MRITGYNKQNKCFKISTELQHRNNTLTVAVYFVRVYQIAQCDQILHQGKKACGEVLSKILGEQCLKTFN